MGWLFLYLAIFIYGTWQLPVAQLNSSQKKHPSNLLLAWKEFLYFSVEANRLPDISLQ